MRRNNPTTEHGSSPKSTPHQSPSANDPHPIPSILKEENRFLHSVLACIQDGISVLAPDLTILFANDTMKAWYAASLPLEGKKCFQCYHHSDHPCNPCPSVRCLTSGMLESDIVPGPQGSAVTWLEVYSYPMKDDTGAVVAVVEFVRDISARREAELKLQWAVAELSEREQKLIGLNQELMATVQQLKASEESLRESEERYRTFYQELRDGCCAIDLQGRFIECNPAFERITGYTRDELLWMRYEDLTPPKWHEMERAILLNQVAVHGYSAPYEKEYRHKDGHVFPIELQAYIKKDTQGNHIGYWAFVRDLSERKQAEAERERLLAIFDATLDFISTALPDGRLQYINAPGKRLVGWDEDTPVTSRFIKDLHPAWAYSKIMQEGVPAAIRDGSWSGETALLHRNGKEIPVSQYIMSHKSSDGTLLYLSTVMRDITERKQAEEAIARSKQLLDRAQSIAQLGSWELDLATGTLYWSDELYRLLGYTPGEVSPSFDCILWHVHEEDRNSLLQLHQHAVEQMPREMEDERRIIRKNGELRTFTTRAIIERDITNKPVRVYGILQDVTEQRKMEHQLEQFAAAIQHAAETVMIMAADGSIQYINPAIEQLTGFTNAEVMGKNPFFTTHGIYTSDFYRSIWETLQSGNVWRGQMTNVDKTGKHYELDTVISPIRDAGGAVVGYVSLGRDITKELTLEQQLRHAQKMEAIGTLAGGIAHDFNNILSAIIGYTELAAEYAPETGNLRYNLAQILKAADRAKNLVQQILAFSRKSQIGHQPLVFAAIITEALKLLRPTLPSTITITTRIIDENAAIMGDPTQIQQVLINLATNAAHAMRDTGGTLTLAVETVLFDAEQAALFPETAPGEYVQLTVSDTGTGISPDIIDRIFDPFFTTKEVGQGSGMGLAVVHGIVKSHNGALRVESHVGQGTTFFIIFPKIHHSTSRQTEETPLVPHGTESVLLVDDEEDLLTVCSGILTSLGYRVTAAHTGAEALGMFLKRPESFDLVITDQTMPGMTGFDLAQKILAVRPSMPIILCTGYSETVSEDKARAIGIRGFVLKPFNRAELAATVRTALESTTGV
ncbi:MAG: PAS domain S-box protein [Desulfobacterota bacterium]|nr:PAS domain S-box protein [Thermodesulfobacteriota bacterium]